MWGNSSPGALASRFARLIEQLGGDTAAAKAMGQQRDLLAAVAATDGGTLNQVSARVKRGAPAVSRAVDALVRSGLVDRQPDPDNRRRLQLRLTEAGREFLNRPPVADSSLEGRISKLAHSGAAFSIFSRQFNWPIAASLESFTPCMPPPICRPSTTHGSPLNRRHRATWSIGICGLALPHGDPITSNMWQVAGEGSGTSIPARSCSTGAHTRSTFANGQIRQTTPCLWNMSRRKSTSSVGMPME